MEICDICKKNISVRRIKIKISKRGSYQKTGYGLNWESNIWTPWTKIYICSECGNKILGMSKLTDDGMKLLETNKEN
jgi:ribosomal protein L37AE/L43A